MSSATAITVKLPDGTPLELPEGATGADAAAAIGPGLAKAALAVSSGGEVRDLAAPLADGEEISIVTDRSPEALDVIRHDAAHVMATAVCELWPGTKVSIGPPINDGFYYDFEFPEGVKVSEADFPAIEEKMAEHIAADETFERTDIPVGDALERFVREEQPFKVELIEDLVRDQGVESVSLYRNGPFTDLCRGPHAPSTGRIKAIKLNSVAGAYWRGDETRQMLTRIYGTAFFSKKDLAAHLERIEEAKARDHRKLGPELDLFLLREEAPGMPFWLPQGTVLLDLIEGKVREQLDKRGYQRIDTPQILDEELWHRSGHYDNYRENMFFAEPAERDRDEHDRRFAVRPMNCPGACLVFDSGRRTPTGSCRCGWPSSAASPATSARASSTGCSESAPSPRTTPTSTARSSRPRTRCVDIIEAIDELYALFGFEDVTVELSTRPEKSIGSDEVWEQAEADAARRPRRARARVRAQPRRRRLLRAEDRLPRHRRARPLLAARHLPARLLHARALRAHLPGRGQRRAPAVDDPPGAARLDGALRGDPDRALRRAGSRTGWRRRRRSCCRSPTATTRPRPAIEAELRELGVRARLDERSESVGRKIRDAELAKVPYMLVLGDREVEAGEPSVRSHADGELGAMSPAALAARLDALSRIGLARRRSRAYTAPRCKGTTPRRAVERPRPPLPARLSVPAPP